MNKKVGLDNSKTFNCPYSSNYNSNKLKVSCSTNNYETITYSTITMAIKKTTNYTFTLTMAIGGYR